MSTSAGEFLTAAAAQYRQLKSLGDRAFAQVEDERFFAVLDGESNSLAVIARHVGGNLLSRWRDFLTTDGEKDDRHRDQEFELPPDATRAQVLEIWERGWACALGELANLTPPDLERTVTIRSEPHTVPLAIQRNLTHTAMHVGQIVFLAKHLAGADWHQLSVPRGRSEDFRKHMRERFEKR